MKWKQTNFYDREKSLETKEMLKQQIDFLEKSEPTEYNFVIVVKVKDNPKLYTIALANNGQFIINNSYFAGCFTEANANDLAEKVKKEFQVITSVEVMTALEFYNQKIKEFEK